jgi:MYXO-CTERM domain-containing protein
MNVRSLAGLIFGLCGVVSVASARSASGSDYQPGLPMACCSPGCTATHGTCNPDCTITCDTGYFDCDANVSNGCECGGGIDKCHDFSCNMTSCVSTAKAPGTDCSTECLTQAVCNSAGECSGAMAIDGTGCTMPPAGCTTAGQCLSGACTCPAVSTNPDMSGVTAASKSGCSIGVGSTATASGLLAFLLLFGGALLLRRRRS